MSINTETLEAAPLAAPAKSSQRHYSFSRRRWNGFDAWQDHVRRSAGIGIVTTFSERHDRDLRRAVVAG